MTNYTKHNVISAATVARLVEEQKKRDKRERGINICGDCEMWDESDKMCWGKPQSGLDTACSLFVKG